MTETCGTCGNFDPGYRASYERYCKSKHDYITVKAHTTKKGLCNVRGKPYPSPIGAIHGFMPCKKGDNACDKWVPRPPTRPSL